MTTVNYLVHNTGEPIFIYFFHEFLSRAYQPSGVQVADDVSSKPAR